MLRSYSLSELCTIVVIDVKNLGQKIKQIEFVLVISRFKLSLMLLGKKEFRDRCTSILGMQMLFILAKHISERLSHSFLLWLSVTRIELASSKPSSSVRFGGALVRFEKNAQLFKPHLL